MTWRFWRKAQPTPEPAPEHKHVHTPRAVKYVTLYQDGPLNSIVIHRCECGDVVKSEIPGEWTLEELTGKPTPAYSDAKFLKDCGIKRFG